MIKSLTTRSKFELKQNKWQGSVLSSESTLHQLSPYIGKMKSSMARTLIYTYTNEGELVYDPFCGSGSIALEAWASNRHIIANDLNPYAFILTKAKLFPFISLDDAMKELNISNELVSFLSHEVDLRKIPKWVRCFFHPDTLREIVAWFNVLTSRNSYFLLSCLLGILHHQRPGFLSFPSSHTVPYLRNKKYPKENYPELYEYRFVYPRLEKKVQRALKRVPLLDCNVTRECHLRDTIDFYPERQVNAIITSPPYMRQLDYGRDNRLRLWFLGENDWEFIDKKVSPSELDFIALTRACFKTWQNVLTPNGLCVFVLGDNYLHSYKLPLPEAIIEIATNEIGGYTLLSIYTESIPANRRVRRGYNGNLKETVLVLKRTKR